MDMIDYQMNMEKLFSKNQLLPRIRAEFTNSDVQLKAFMEAKDIDPDFGFDLLVQMVLHKRVTVSVLVGILRKHFENSQQTMDEIQKCAEADLIDWSPLTEQFIMRIDISADVKEELERYQYPLPMIVEPKTIKKNTDTGYLVTKGSVILKNNHHDDDVCLDHLNRMNRIRFRLNHTTASLIQNEWKNLDKPKEDEDHASWQRRVRQFEKYDRTCRDIFVHAEIAGGGFYLTHKYDKRGRSYSQGYHINYQGNTWNKAVIEFEEGEFIT